MKQLFTLLLLFLTGGILFGQSNVGIGVSDPLDRLHVKDGAIRIEHSTNPTFKLFQGATQASSIAQFSDNLIIHNHENGNIGFNINGFTRMFIKGDGNVAIGTTSPTATLDVNGTVRFRNGAGNGYVAMTDAAGNLTWTNPASINGVWTVAGNDMYNTNTGNVGIGLTVPLSKLHIAGGDLRIEDGVPQLALYQGNTFAAFLQSNSTDLQLSNKLSGSFQLLTGNLIRLVVDNSGRIGMGTTAPQEKLHLVGRMRIEDTNPLITMYDGPTYKGFLYHFGDNMALANKLNGNLEFRTNDLNRMVIAGNGDVGLGTTTPSSKLHVMGFLRVDDPQPLITFYDQNTYKGNIYIQGNDMTMGNLMNGDLNFNTNGGNRMHISNIGRVGIGTINPQEELHVAGDIWNDGSLKMEGNNKYIDFNPSAGALAGMRWMTDGAFEGGWFYDADNVQLNLSSGTTTPGLSFDLNNRRVGIGTLNPQTPLHLVGSMRVENVNPGVFFYGTGGAGQYAAIHHLTNNLQIRNSVGGDILFFTAGSSSPRMVINSGGNIGIGTDSPSTNHLVDIVSTDSHGLNLLNTYSGGSSKYGLRVETSDAGSGLNRYGVWATAVGKSSSSAYGVYGLGDGNGTNATLYGVRGSVTTSGTGTKYGVYGSAPVANNSWGLYVGGGFSYFDNDVRIGHTDDVPGYMLSVDGKVISEEIKVQMSGSWPDYVFDESYELPSLSETKAFIQSHKHLPGVPSAEEVSAENGIELGEMNRILLEKVEELTLHVIRLQEQIEDIKANQD